MFTATLFTVAKRWKQVQCLSIADGIRKMWHIHTGMLFSLKKKKVLSYART